MLPICSVHFYEQIPTVILRVNHQIKKLIEDRHKTETPAAGKNKSDVNQTKLDNDKE